MIESVYMSLWMDFDNISVGSSNEDMINVWWWWWWWWWRERERERESSDTPRVTFLI